jgi:hypothetical protein
MNCRMPRISSLLLIASLLTFAARSAAANDLSEITGSYKVVETTGVGARTRVKLQIELVNRGQRDLRIRQLALSGFTHPEKAASPLVELVIHPQTSEITTREFTLRRPEYEQLRRGTRPRLLLSIAIPGGRQITNIVRLDRVTSKKGN